MAEELDGGVRRLSACNVSHVTYHDPYAVVGLL